MSKIDDDNAVGKKSNKANKGWTSHLVGKQWWADNNPKKTATYISIWLLCAVSTVMLSIDGYLICLKPEIFKGDLPRYLPILWFVFFMKFLIFFTRSNRLLKLNAVLKQNNEEVCAVKRSYFPGWALVMAVWVVAGHTAQICFLSTYAPGGDVFGITVPANMVFAEKFWYPFLGTISSVFIVNDMVRQKVAKDAEDFFENIATNIFSRFKILLSAFGPLPKDEKKHEEKKE